MSCALCPASISACSAALRSEGDCSARKSSWLPSWLDVSCVVVGEAVVHEKQSNSGVAEEDAKHGVVARVS